MLILNIQNDTSRFICFKCIFVKYYSSTSQNDIWLKSAYMSWNYSSSRSYWKIKNYVYSANDGVSIDQLLASILVLHERWDALPLLHHSTVVLLPLATRCGSSRCWASWAPSSSSCRPCRRARSCTSSSSPVCICSTSPCRRTWPPLHTIAMEV